MEAVGQFRCGDQLAPENEPTLAVGEMGTEGPCDNNDVRPVSV